MQPEPRARQVLRVQLVPQDKALRVCRASRVPRERPDRRDLLAAPPDQPGRVVPWDLEFKDPLERPEREPREQPARQAQQVQPARRDQPASDTLAPRASASPELPERQDLQAPPVLQAPQVLLAPLGDPSGLRERRGLSAVQREPQERLAPEAVEMSLDRRER